MSYISMHTGEPCSEETMLQECKNLVDACAAAEKNAIPGEPLYVIHWKSQRTGIVGHGKPVTLAYIGALTANPAITPNSTWIAHGMENWLEKGVLPSVG
jgi:hypothetical protein